MRKHLTYANVMVTILAFLVLAGGGAYAASKLAKNSVGPKQLKNNAVTRAKIKKHAVSAAKLDPSVLAPYAKRGEFLNGNDVISPLISASLRDATYNVGKPGGVDCQGVNEEEFPENMVDDIDFQTVEFDHGGLVHTEPGAAPNCFNGFEVQREGTYLLNAWVGWQEEGVSGSRFIAIQALRPNQKCCDRLALTEGPSGSGGANTAQNATAVARLTPGTFVFVQGFRENGTVRLFQSGFQIAYLGN